MKNLKIYVAAATLLTISGIVGCISGINDVKELKENQVESELPQDEEKEQVKVEKQSPAPSIKVEIDENGSSEVRIVGDNNQVKINGIETPSAIISSKTESIENAKEETQENTPTIIPEQLPKTESTKEFQYFEEEKESLKDALTNGDIDTIKELGKNYAKIGKDFVLNGTEINGVTFNELTEQGKIETLQNLNIIDGWIMEVDPDYKEQIQNGVEKAKSGLGAAKERVKNWFDSFGK